MKNKRPELAKSEIVKNLPKACGDETAAVEFFEQQRWGDAPCCAHCKSKDVYKMLDRDGTRNKRFLWRCRECGEQYTVRIGTIYQESRLPLRHWAYTFWRACSSKKGVSAREIERHCQISYKSALFLLHRIRHAVAEDGTSPKLDGTCEIDETYVGGKPRFRGFNTPPAPRGRGTKKTPLIAMLQRDGGVRTKVVQSITHKNIDRFMQDNVAKSAVVNTDEFAMYRPLLRAWKEHQKVFHSVKEYARHNPDGSVSHVNTCESFFSLLKRGLNGIFHAVSKEHLHRYASEFEFRWNTRRLSDGERIAAAIQKSLGKRLTYEQSVFRYPQHEAEQKPEEGQGEARP